jgi:phage major head subunit gpT-like protein
MTIRSTNFSELLAPGLRKIYFDKFNELPTEYDKIANVMTTKRAYEDDYRMAGFGLWGTKTEGTATTYSDAMPGGTRRYTPSPFGLGFRITREMVDDDLYMVMGKRMSAKLAWAGRATVENTFAGLINDAFNGTTYTGFDSLALCSTVHTLLRGGTYANKPSTDTTLSVTALQAAINSFDNMVSDENLKIALRPRTLLVAPEWKWAAREILRSEYKPYTANNEVNPLKEEDLQFMVYHYFSSTDDWHLMAAPGQHDVNFFWRIRPEFHNGDDFDTGDAKFRGYQRYTCGFGDWHGWYGSSGAA